ncbi:MAG: Wzz/FepE/Etk N-terminal domain-containing protein [Chloroflexota bacterium]
MELKNYLQILMRWIWLVSLCTILGTVSGYGASRLEKPTYQAITKILISKDLSDQNSQFAAMSTQQLIDAYVQLLSSSSVIDEASRRINYEINLKDLGSVQQIRSTSVIEITMEDTDPQRAAAIVNMLVLVLIDRNTQSSGYAPTEENIKQNITEVEGQISTLQNQFNQLSDEKLQGQLKQVNDQITSLQDQISNLSMEIGPLASLEFPTVEQSSQLAEKQARLVQLQSLIDQYQQIRINLEFVGKPVLSSNNQGGDVRLQLLQSTLDQYQKIYLDLLNNLQTVQIARLRSAPTIDQIEKAIPPAKPVRPQPRMYAILGGIVGMVLTMGMIFVIEYLDDTLKTPQDVQQALGIPVLGSITNMQSVSNTTKGLPVAWQLPSQTSEAIDALLTNLEFSGAEASSLKTLLVIGINESDAGKTSLAADLAVSYVQSGSSVVLLDADLQNPSAHRYFGLANENGFSDLLADDSKTKAAGKKVEGLDGLSVITGGNANTAPTTDGVTKPNRIVKILDTLRKQSDVVIIAAPSINVADSWVLAAKVDGVLLVIQPGVTNLSEARRSLEQLKRAGATIPGVVFYDTPHDLAYYYKHIRSNRIIASLSKIRLRSLISK